MPCDPNLSLLHFIQSLSKLQFFSFTCLVLFLLLLVITLDIEHLNSYHYNILLGLRSKGLMKQLQFPGAKPIQLHCSTACASTSTCTDTCIYTYIRSWLGLMTSEPKGLTKKYSQGENLFLCNKFISSSIDFVAITCILALALNCIYLSLVLF